MTTSVASTTYAEPHVEPWISGTHTDTPVVARAVLHALDLSAHDIARWTAGLTDEEVHAHPLGLPPVAFHLRHIARSVDRILCYAEGNQLTEEQLALLKSEQSGNESLATLLVEIETSFFNAGERIRILATADLNALRGVGRRQLPSTVGGAFIHVADHTQRHAGQIITTSKVLMALRG